MKIYIAGPLFTRAEQDFNNRLADALDTQLLKSIPKYNIYLPQKSSKKYLDTKDFEGLFQELKTKINECDVMIAILDGPDADSGTCWEVGYAYAKKKLILGIRTDFRAGEISGINLMLEKSITEYMRINNQNLSYSDMALGIYLILVKMITETI